MARESIPWRFLDCGPGPGSWQMAVDEALLERVASGALPTLRVFAFHPTCLSLGRFQPACCQLNAAALHAAGVDIVRRPTGGRAVLHAGDLCYAVIAPIADSGVGGSIRDSYRRIAVALALALDMIGARADVAATFPGRAGRTPPASRRSSCFALTGPFEIAVDGAKLIGSAQVRRGLALLQQGSIRLAADAALESRLLQDPAPAASLREILGRDVTYTEMAVALRRSFAEALDLCLEEANLTEEEQALAQRLERDKYANPCWTWER